MEKIFIWARLVDISHEIETLLKRVKRMRRYPKPRTEKIMIERSAKVVQIGFELLGLRQEAINRIMYAKQPIYPEGGFGGVNVQEAGDALRLTLSQVKSEEPILQPKDLYEVNPKFKEMHSKIKMDENIINTLRAAIKSRDGKS